MKLVYGTYTTEANEVTLQIQKRAQFSARGYRVGTREQWTIQGILQAASVSALTTALDSLEDAFATNGLDLKLTEDDGTNTQHVLLNADTVGGVRITGFSYPKGEGVEYTTYRTYQITAEALRNDEEQELLAFQETVEIAGSGGPRRVLIEILNGPPQEQITNLATITRIVQRGQAVGYSVYPAPAAPSIPAWESGPERIISRTAPESQRGSFVGFVVNWQYVMLAPTPITVLPQTAA